jgi:hypothetical protein
MITRNINTRNTAVFELRCYSVQECSDIDSMQSIEKLPLGAYKTSSINLRATSWRILVAQFAPIEQGMCSWGSLKANAMTSRVPFALAVRTRFVKGMPDLGDTPADGGHVRGDIECTLGARGYLWKLEAFVNVGPRAAKAQRFKRGSDDIALPCNRQGVECCFNSLNDVRSDGTCMGCMTGVSVVGTGVRWVTGVVRGDGTCMGRMIWVSVVRIGVRWVTGVVRRDSTRMSRMIWVSVVGIGVG